MFNLKPGLKREAEDRKQTDPRGLEPAEIRVA